MKKILNFLNSMQTLAGHFFLLLFGLCVFAVIKFIEEGFYGLNIFGTVLLCGCALLMLLTAFDHFKKAHEIVNRYTKEERDHAGDLLIGRVQGGKYL